MSHKIENGVRYNTNPYLPDRHPSAQPAHDFRTIPEYQEKIDSRAQLRKWVSICTGARAKVQAMVDVKAVEVDGRIDVAIRCTVGGAGHGLADADQIVAAISKAADVAQRDPKTEVMLKGLDRSIAKWESEIKVVEDLLRRALPADHLQALGIALPPTAPVPPPSPAPSPNSAVLIEA